MINTVQLIQSYEKIEERVVGLAKALLLKCDNDINKIPRNEEMEIIDEEFNSLISNIIIEKIKIKPARHFELNDKVMEYVKNSLLKLYIMPALEKIKIIQSDKIDIDKKLIKKISKKSLKLTKEKHIIAAYLHEVYNRTLGLPYLEDDVFLSVILITTYKKINKFISLEELYMDKEVLCECIEIDKFFTISGRDEHTPSFTQLIINSYIRKNNIVFDDNYTITNMNY